MTNHSYIVNDGGTRRARLIDCLSNMLGVENGYPPAVYTWLHAYATYELQNMLNARQVNTPELFARFGYYVM